MIKVAFFVDWDNLRKILHTIKSHSKKSEQKITTFDYNNASHISTLFQHFLEKDERLYRIFFYTAKPLKDEDIMSQLRKKSDKTNYQSYLNLQGEKNKIYNRATAFLDEIVKEEFIALRTGKMQVRGIVSGGRPDIVQKQVDMLIGLDISEISYNKHADKIMVFSKDTDMIPALKTARINGLTVAVANFTESDYIAKDIILHSDLICNRSLYEIDQILHK
jgi:uncharacterized LabA/DUF88 family protein